MVPAAYTPILFLSWLGFVDLQGLGAYTSLFLASRIVTLALAEGTLVVVSLCGRELYGPRGAVFAALTTALMAPFVYYGKLANLDVPYLFWFALSLLAYIRILENHARRDYVLFAVSATLAVCTKDQAYGLYALTSVAILVARWRGQRAGHLPRTIFDRTTTLAVGAAKCVNVPPMETFTKRTPNVAYFSLALGCRS